MRPARAQVAALFAVMQRALADELPVRAARVFRASPPPFLSRFLSAAKELLRAGVRLRVAGDTSALPPVLAAALAAACAATSGGSALQLTICVNYSGRRDPSSA